MFTSYAFIALIRLRVLAPDEDAAVGIVCHPEVGGDLKVAVLGGGDQEAGSLVGLHGLSATSQLASPTMFQPFRLEPSSTVVQPP
jgi:hypothetical protein